MLVEPSFTVNIMVHGTPVDDLLPWGPMSHHGLCCKSVYQEDTDGDNQTNMSLLSAATMALIP